MTDIPLTDAVACCERISDEMHEWQDRIGAELVTVRYPERVEQIWIAPTQDGCEYVVVQPPEWRPQTKGRAAGWYVGEHHEKFKVQELK